MEDKNYLISEQTYKRLLNLNSDQSYSCSGPPNRLSCIIEKGDTDNEEMSASSSTNSSPSKSCPSLNKVMQNFAGTPVAKTVQVAAEIAESTVLLSSSSPWQSDNSVSSDVGAGDRLNSDQALSFAKQSTRSSANESQHEPMNGYCVNMLGGPQTGPEQSGSIDVLKQHALQSTVLMMCSFS
ncbi:hypothetical protein Ciccas_000948 [Cichlidogyrus casuarinus]|uniref:Uncharacterized protein n=1 Tax=Cichlidogyrus casuarinus TaxID=1844966 RepID=A0ABD2QLI0_9PLAT